MLVSKCQLDTKNIQLQQTLMSADYCRATNGIASRRAQWDLNAFPPAWCCSSWMLGIRFQTSFSSLYSSDFFIPKQVKSLRQSDLCSNWGHSLIAQTSAYTHTVIGPDSPDATFWVVYFCHRINAMESARQFSQVRAYQPAQTQKSLS